MKHDTFKGAFPLQTYTQKHKIEAMAASYANISRILVQGLTAEQKAISMSLVVTVLEELASDKSMDGIIASVKCWSFLQSLLPTT